MRPNIAFDVKWRPYRLDPTVPKGGMDRQAYMRAKFGDDPMKIVEMHKLIAAEGAKDGIEFDFAAIARRPDTLDSHRLIRWAEATACRTKWWSGCSSPISRMARISATSACWPTSPISAAWTGWKWPQMLESDTDIALVEREDQIAHEMGVTGVPAMIFGNKLAVSGAREPEMLAVGDRPGGGDASGSGQPDRERRRS